MDEVEKHKEEKRNKDNTRRNYEGKTRRNYEGKTRPKSVRKRKEA